MRAVDTNVLVRLLTRDDPDQVARADSFVSAGAWVSHLVLTEAVWVLKAVYGVTPSRIAAGIELLLGHKALAVQDPDVVARALSAFRRKPALGFSDCLVLAVARRAGHLPLGTFDKALAKLDGTELI
jgi:predicted nucleic-acid-binding protein